MNINQPNLLGMSHEELEDEVLRLRSIVFEDLSNTGQIQLDQCRIYTIFEYAILNKLWKRRGTILSRDFLIDQCHRPNCNSTDRSIDTHIKKIRVKFKKYGVKTKILTKYGFGYYIEADDFDPFDIEQKSRGLDESEREWDTHVIQMLQRKAAGTNLVRPKKTARSPTDYGPITTW